MGSLKTTQIVQGFVVVAGCPIGAHIPPFLLLILPLPTHDPRIHFTHDCDTIYHDTIYRGLLSMGPFAPLDTHTNLLHSSTFSSFLHTSHSTDNAKIGPMPQNSWYDDECQEIKLASNGK